MIMAMTRFDKEKLVEIVLYVLNKKGGLDYYSLIKTLYFAELDHLAKWGRRITADDVCAMPYGPVLSHLLNAIKNDGKDKELADMLHNVFQAPKNDAPYVLLPLREADEDYLSESEKEALDKSIAENSSLSFSQLMSKSHDEVWKKYFENGTGRKVIPTTALADAAHASDVMKEYIRENMELDKIFS